MKKEYHSAACTVLENYLDGAIEDMSVDNYEFIYDVICVLRALGDASCKSYLKKFNDKLDKIKYCLVE